MHVRIVPTPQAASGNASQPGFLRRQFWQMNNKPTRAGRPTLTLKSAAIKPGRCSQNVEIHPAENSGSLRSVKSTATFN
jgi:hypothetical protein